MRPAFAPDLVNGPFGDPALLIDFVHRRRALLFDIGDVGRLATRKLLRVSDVFVSHAHMDHFAGFDRLLRVCLGRSAGVRLYGPPGFLDRVGSKLGAYTWNVVQNYQGDFVVFAHEVVAAQGPQPALRLRTASFSARQRFARADGADATAADGVLLAEPELRVRAALLDHGTPCLAFALEETRHVNIWKVALAELGLPTGPWLRALKAAVVADAPDSTPIVARWTDRGGAHERTIALGELRGRVTQLVPGQKIAYVTDVAYTPGNARAIAALAARADLLFIEAAFAGEHAELARRRYHLTAAQSGGLARAAGAARAVPFHFSPRYLGREQSLRDEFAAAFGR